MIHGFYWKFRSLSSGKRILKIGWDLTKLPPWVWCHQIAGTFLGHGVYTHVRHGDGCVRKVRGNYTRSCFYAHAYTTLDQLWNTMQWTPDTNNIISRSLVSQHSTAHKNAAVVELVLLAAPPPPVVFATPPPPTKMRRRAAAAAAASLSGPARRR